MRVPTDVTVWLGVLSVAITIVYTIIKARAKAFLSFPGTGTDRSAITRESQLFQVDKALIRRWMQEKILEQCEQKLCRIRFVRRRFREAISIKWWTPSWRPGRTISIPPRHTWTGRAIPSRAANAWK